MDSRASEAERLLISRRRVLSLDAAVAAGIELPETARQELIEIEEALARIAAGTYGSCQTCGGAIGRDRLRALPEVRFCQACSSPARRS
jgi:DnaK suppressor protein